MVKEIVRDTFFLAQKSEPAGKEDVQVIQDLLDTIKANSDRCVGLAANMIGARKTILVALIGNSYLIMVNPRIIRTSPQIYETEEGCLSLNGQRKVKRYKSVAVEFLDSNFRKKIQTFRDFEAQIIQHEIDHFSGILI
ncbi:MAG: peptide deformylase [Ruminococcus flavefaciens]|nr:peptide deformylase [Ruminococcus flavefaciens]MCM1229865.1 peptide deformylase [Ruminococcus flavefaciens]